MTHTRPTHGDQVGDRGRRRGAVAGSCVRAAQTAPPAAAGYGKDPDLLKTYAAGELWPLTLNDAQRATTRVLCDLIIPADETSPAASAVATHQFIDEWISAPYPDCQRDRELHRPRTRLARCGVAAPISAQFRRRPTTRRRRICDDICDARPTKPQFAEAAAFFNRFRELTALGYYTTPIGMKDLRYTGNEPLVTFEGPPAEVLKKLGL